MHRIKANSITEAIAEAMDNAGDMENVVILYQNKPGSKISFGFITDPNGTVERTNWMIDTFKYWLLGCYSMKEED